MALSGHQVGALSYPLLGVRADIKPAGAASKKSRSVEASRTPHRRMPFVAKATASDRASTATNPVGDRRSFDQPRQFGRLIFLHSAEPEPFSGSRTWIV